MRLLDGRILAQERLAALRPRVMGLRTPPVLAAVLVGDDPASRLYLKLKAEACQQIGLAFRQEELPPATPEADVVARVRKLNADPDVTGIIVQLPLPAPLDADRIIAAIDPRKDADGFHPKSLAAFYRNDPSALTPGLIRAVWALAAATKQRLAGRTAVVVANSQVFSHALVAFLERQGLRSRSIEPTGVLRSATREGDLLVVAVGRPKAITGDDVKPGSIVIDIGTNRVAERLVGDVDPDRVRGVAAWLSPVPGGVGPLTVASLLENVVELAERHRAPDR